MRLIRPRAASFVEAKNIEKLTALSRRTAKSWLSLLAQGEEMAMDVEMEMDHLSLLQLLGPMLVEKLELLRKPSMRLPK